jgi:hypothetical protein
MAPPLVILRLMDLRKAGCPLSLPQARLQTAVPGQEVWVEAVRLLQHLDSAEVLDSAEGRRAASARTSELLRKLARDRFSLIARNPPLLYHNDLTASVRRFYWSEEFGYALWLRLYFENEHARSRLACRDGDASQECMRK